METKGLNPGDKIYVDFEPSMEWVWEDTWGSLILYLPGFNKQQLRVQVSASGMLKLSGERPIGGDRWNRFYKEVQIPKNCNSNAISAKFEDNILYVQLSKNNVTDTTTPRDQLQDTTTAKTQPQPQPQPQTQTPPPKPPKPAPSQEPPKQQLSDSLKEATKQKPTDEPYTPTEQHKEKPKDNNSTASPAVDGKNGVFPETDKTAEKRDDDHQGKDGKDIRGGSEQEGNNGGSAEKAAKLDQEAPSVALGSCNSALENYTNVVGGLARDLRKGGKLFNLAVTVLVALLLGIYFGNMVKSSGTPEI